jgi:hypothetical protein
MKPMLKGVLLVVIVCLAVAGSAAVFNNASLSHLTQGDVRVQLTNGIYLGTEWTREHAQDLLTRPNSALFHMITDMARISDNEVMAALSAAYLRQPDHNIWRRLSDKNRPAEAPSIEEVKKLQDYQQWLLYAVDPEQVPLDAEERARMFDPAMHVSGSLTHQLFALEVYREFQGSTTELDALLDHLCERIAREEWVDFRVSDLYLQRVAFLLAAGRPDLVKRRWIERILENQRDDGGWTYPWYYWGPGLLRFHTHLQPPTAHPTIQGLWALYQIQYRYPDWITTHYPE